LELRQFREFLAQLSPNAALFSQLLEQVLYEIREDTENQIGGFSLSPGPLRKGFVLMHMDIAKVQANRDLYHVKVSRDWAKQYFIVTDVIGGIPYVSPLPPVSSLPHQLIPPALNQQFVIVTLRALLQPIGRMLQDLLGPGSSVHLAGPSTSEVRQRASAR